MTGYEFHPEARFDLEEVWEFIRADNLDAADRRLREHKNEGANAIAIEIQRPELEALIRERMKAAASTALKTFSCRRKRVWKSGPR